jgi:peptidoglycan/xylan/chitin deacetylase (PgdA/CDA1 family)
MVYPSVNIYIPIWIMLYGILNLSLFSTPTNIQPNELGKIPIFSYHKISTYNNNLNRTPESFRKDLDYLRKNKYTLITVENLYKGWIDVPLGNIPAILAFDDSHISQFKYLSKDKIDPNSAIGILEEYKKQYPKFKVSAIFFVTPCQPGENLLFGQQESIAKKLNFLIKNGYEIGNHSCAHIDYQKSKIEKIQTDLILSQKKIKQYLPNFHFKYLATPYGGYPKRRDWKFLAKPKKGKQSYNHKLVFSYSNRPALSPFESSFANIRVSRLHSYEEALSSFYKQIESKDIELFISDGIPNLVTIPKDKRAKLKLIKGKNLVLAPNGQDSYAWKEY